LTKLNNGVVIIDDYPDFSVLFKPHNLPTTPTKNGEIKSLVEIFREAFPGVIAHPEIHRLDMQTSGIVVFAKNQRSHSNLSKQFAQKSVKKEYDAILSKEIDSNTGEINLPLIKDFNHSFRHKVDMLNGKIAITIYKVIEVKEGKTFIRFFPKTGKTHQLRIHSASKLGLDAPILGDKVYGSVKADRMYLHASKIEFSNPVTNERLLFLSPSNFF
jgi:tRNA pseudouridine32 synthase/23S rRNA pseudouridine746 synthase